MRKILSFSFFILTGFYVLSAQQVSPAVIAADGGSNEVNGVRLDWTVGEPAIESVKETSTWYTEGFHQPMLVVERLLADVDDSTDADNGMSMMYSNDIMVAPNPVSSRLVITMPKDGPQPKHLHLFRQDGTSVTYRKIDVQETSIELDMSSLAAGMYLLRLVAHDGQDLSTFKISKIQ